VILASEGIGTAAKTVMEITSFLFPDDIPKELINVGSPVVEDDDINDTVTKCPFKTIAFVATLLHI
jgi:hypothetical protein